MLTIQQAFDNIVNVVSNAKMTSQEHDALKESVQIVVKRCEVADRLEAAAQGAAKESLDKENVELEAENIKLREENQDGPTNEPTNVPGTDKKVS